MTLPSPQRRTAIRRRSTRPALAAAAAVHLPAPAPPIDRDAIATHEAEQIALRDATDARPFLDRLPFGVLVYRLSHLIYCNRAFLRWSGYESIEALAEAGGLDSLFVEPEGVSFEKGGEKPFAISSSRGEKTEAEGRLFLVPWDGESAFALLTTPVAQAREPNGSPALELAQAEIAELNSILDTATDGVVLIDRAGLVLSSNRSAEALFGYESRELAGRSFFDLLAPESMDVASEYLDGLRQEGAARLLNSGRDVIGRVRQGGLIPLFMTLGRIGDRPDKLCAVFRDITPWKKAEEELTDAKRQAEKASSAKSDFLAKISHEIRTPLNSIIGFSEVMMEERFGPVGNERYRAYLKDIHASGGHLISLINDLLDLSKIEAGKLELTFAGVSLNDLTQQCVAIMQPQANRERIILRTSLAPKLPQIVADARSVRQIVLNLLSNSIKFTGAGGQVIVSTALTDARRGGPARTRHRHRHEREGHRDRARAVPAACHLGARRRHRARPAADQGAGGGKPRELPHQERAERRHLGGDRVSGDAGAGGLTARQAACVLTPHPPAARAARS